MKPSAPHTANNVLFVYGTLQPGGPNEHVLAPLEGVWHPGVVMGVLKNAGWGAELGYPALVPDDAGDAVSGQVLVSAELPDYWSMLDEFEGEQYRRSQVTVHLEQGGTMLASAYVLIEAGLVAGT